MNKVYIFSHWVDTDYKFQKEIDEVKQLNPDYLFANCTFEYEAAYIFRHLIAGISDWLVENNKKLIILCSGPDGLEIAPNVILEKCYGFHPQISHICRNAVEGKTDKLEEGISKWFTCYNNNPKYERALLLDQLVANSLMQHGIITFHDPINISGVPEHLRPFKWKYHDGSRLVDEPDYENYAGRPGQNVQYASTKYPKSYFKGLVDVVCESAYTENVFFVTEKTGKPIAALKPFITLSCVNYHKFLVDEYGLLLYDEIFDYSFDSKPNIEDRVQGIIDNLNNLVDQDLNNTKKIYESLLPKMIHNRQMILDYSDNKEKMIPKSLRFMTETSDYTVYGDSLAWQSLAMPLVNWLRKGLLT